MITDRPVHMKARLSWLASLKYSRLQAATPTRKRMNRPANLAFGKLAVSRPRGLTTGASTP